MALVHGQQHAVHDTDDRGLRRVKWTVGRLEDRKEVVLAGVVRDSGVHDFLDNFGDKAQVRDGSI